MRVAESVGVQVVDHAAVILTEQRVLALAGFELGQVVGQKLVQELERVRAIEQELAHM